MKKYILLISITVLIFCQYIYSQNIKNTAVIGFYNLENLFDTINDPTINDEEFLPDSENRWNTAKYLEKLHNLSMVIADMAKKQGGVVVLGVSEVENRGVLEDLVSTDILKPLNYAVAHHNSPDLRGIDVAFIYQKDRFKLIGENFFPLKTNNPDFITRDQYLIKGILDQTDTIYLLVNHYPSKRGGEKRSAPYRIAAASLSRHIADSLMNQKPNAKIIIMGDLNDNPNSKPIIEYLKPKGKIKNVGTGDLFNPMWQMYRDGIGSYAYKDSWELIDQIIVSYGLIHPEKGEYAYNNAQVFHTNYMVTVAGPFAGYPFRTYAGGVYAGGYSDHFPVYIVLQKK